MIVAKRCTCPGNCECHYHYKFKHRNRRYRASTHTANYKLACRIAQRKYNEAIAKKAGVEELPAVTATLSELCKRFEPWYQEAFPTSALRCNSVLPSFQAAFTPRDPAIVDITTFDLERWRTSRAKVVQRNSAQTDAFVVGAMFREAERFYPGYVRPTLKAWKIEDGNRRILSAEEIEVALTLLPPTLALIGRVTLECLPRIAEVVGLTRHDIGTTMGSYWFTRRLKGGKRLRIDIPAALYQALTARLVRPGQVYLFEVRPHCGPHKGQWIGIRPGTASQMFTRGFRKLGLFGLTHHKFRHTAVTMMLDGGENPQAIQELAGWTSLQMLKHYGHVRDAARQKAVRGNADAIAAILSGPKVVRKEG